MTWDVVAVAGMVALVAYTAGFVTAALMQMMPRGEQGGDDERGE